MHGCGIMRWPRYKNAGCMFLEAFQLPVPCDKGTLPAALLSAGGWADQCCNVAMSAGEAGKRRPPHAYQAVMCDFSKTVSAMGQLLPWGVGDTAAKNSLSTACLSQTVQLFLAAVPQSDIWSCIAQLLIQEASNCRCIPCVFKAEVAWQYFCCWLPSFRVSCTPLHTMLMLLFLDATSSYKARRVLLRVWSPCAEEGVLSW